MKWISWIHSDYLFVAVLLLYFSFRVNLSANVAWNIIDGLFIIAGVLMIYNRFKRKNN